MTDQHRRKSPRLTDYDYSQEGAYFVTICTQNRLCLFGEVADDVMQLNAAGMMVEGCFDELQSRFASLKVDCQVVMPNHVHAILILNDQSVSVVKAVQWYKSKTTNGYMKGVKTSDWQPFPSKLWQRSFYDHVIRHDADLSRIREYISVNPAKWALDKNNPDNLG